METVNEEDHLEIGERVAYTEPEWSPRQGTRVGTVVARTEKPRSVNVHMKFGYQYEVQWDAGPLERHYSRGALVRVERLNSHEMKP